MKIFTVLVALGLLVFGPCQLTGQVQRPNTFALHEANEILVEQPNRTADLLIVGMISGVGGFGVAAGAALIADGDYGIAIHTGLLGSALGMPLGIWSANGRRGDVGNAVLASLAASGVVYFVGPLIFGPGFPGFFFMPPAQLLSSFHVIGVTSN